MIRRWHAISLPDFLYVDVRAVRRQEALRNADAANESHFICCPNLYHQRQALGTDPGFKKGGKLPLSKLIVVPTALLSPTVFKVDRFY